MTPQIKINRPNLQEVQNYLKLNEHYDLQEKALKKLFTKTYPKNNDIDDILIKASSLNDFYSTNIFSIFPVAKHIKNLKIDEGLENGDLTLVSKIANIKINGVNKNFYSFASKYCSHHKPLIFPIYDYYVDKLITYFQKKDNFYDSEFNLKNYEIFCNIINEFITYYKLNNFNIKEIDKYLWQLGKVAFPRNYKKQNNKA
ncbi:hypothetical protein L8W69_01685 [Campylobacter sp. CNRCH_2016_3089]|uniref:hypothetical protein n=1 Tax=Campylobacter TaxID=194 RepID=UPI0021E6AC4F|nr:MULTISPECIES: hypothetical protein [Campylobacter]MCV3472847.1 hypothetical protein [Campylobacter sp. CNRCH_2014_2849]MCV3507940.1 hypothetical protein [Campylobacter sp. CNRCH_2016_3089]MCW0185159.1 hypothetical protein [Campylobacter lari]